MKVFCLSLLIAALLTSCQEDGSQNDPNALFIKKNSVTSGSLSDNNVNSDDPNAPTDAPIDGGLGFLLVAGAAYGAKKIRDRRVKDQA